jgi:hypothetical protein
MTFELGRRLRSAELTQTRCLVSSPSRLARSAIRPQREVRQTLSLQSHIHRLKKRRHPATIWRLLCPTSIARSLRRRCNESIKNASSYCRSWRRETRQISRQHVQLTLSFALPFSICTFTKRTHLITPPQTHHANEFRTLQTMTRRMIRSDRTPAAMYDSHARA